MQRKAQTMSDTDTSSWLLSVVGSNQTYHISPGQSVIIGRTPIRASSLKKDGAENIPRMNISDRKKSLSKAHLRVSVNNNGDAEICDLNSANGTYVVRKDDAMMALPPHRPIVLDKSPIRLQLGDVGLWIEKVLSQSEDTSATDGNSEGEMADIAEHQGRQQGISSGIPHGNGTRGSTAGGQGVSPSLPPKGTSTAPGVPGNTPLSSKTIPAPVSTVRGLPFKNGAPSSVFPQQDSQKATQTGSFAAVGTQQVPQSSTFAVQQSTSSGNIGAGYSSQSENENMRIHDVLEVRAGEPTHSLNAQDIQRSIYEARERQNNAQGFPGTQSTQFAAVNQFEPGSVFEQVRRHQKAVEEASTTIAGFSIEEVKRSADQKKQFEMAKYQELLPYLALNPYLYEDLYIWLAAMEDPTIQRALSTNRGYLYYISEKEDKKEGE